MTGLFESIESNGRILDTSSYHDRRRSILSRIFLASLTVFIAGFLQAFTANAQDFRATLQGQVTDSTGAVLPGSQVVLTNVNTNETSRTQTNSDGNYVVRLLQPGRYKMSIGHSGFRTFIRQDVVLEINEVAVINAALSVGSSTAEVVVTSDLPLLDAGNADRGQVLDTQQVSQLPLIGQNPIVLATLSPGVQYSGNIIYSRPFDNGALAQWNINGGGNNTAEFLLDGAPNESQAGVNNIALMPPGPSVSEFKVAGPAYNAQYGRSSGSIISYQLKSGTNKLHGTVYEFGTRSWMNANSFQDKASNPVVPRPYHKVDQYGFEADGPVFFPKVYDGRGKTFFMASYERYNEFVPNAGTISVPAPEFRTGDFSKLTDASGAPILIYDPATGQNVNGVWTRQPFPGNIIPVGRIDPIAQKILSYFPAPNQTGAGVGYSINNLFLTGAQAEQTLHYNVLVFKIDHTIGPNDRIFFRHGNTHLGQFRPQNGILNGAPGNNAYYPYLRQNEADVFDWSHVIGPSSVLDTRISFSRYVEGQQAGQNQGFDPTQLGFPASVASEIPHGEQFGTYNFGTYTFLGGNYNTTNFTDTFSIFPSFVKVMGKHTLTAGADLRWLLYIPQNYGNPFNFASSKGFTQRDYTTGDAHSGNEIASFLIDGPATISSDNNAAPTFEYRYEAPYFQDDWRITPRLTVNLGVRWDFNLSPFERQNKLVRGFDVNATNPVDALVNRAAYPSLATLKGALQFAGVNGQPRRVADLPMLSIQPRVGFAYQVYPNTVLRAGFGRFFPNPTQDYLQTTGFSQTTSTPTSLDGGRTIAPNLLEAPFPNGLQPPPGSSLGALTALGNNVNYFNPSFKAPYDDQFSVGIEQAFAWNSKLDISYVGNRYRNGQSSLSLNNISASLRNQCNAMTGGNQNVCNAQAGNPFNGVAAFQGTSYYTLPTLSVYNLNVAFPEFTGVTELGRNDNSSWYNALQTTYKVRAGSSLNALASYTYSKQMEVSGFRDPILLVPQREISGLDHTHQFTLAIVNELPFGPGRRFLHSSNPIMERLVSGFQDSWTFAKSSGRLWGLPSNVIQTGPAYVHPNWNQPIVRGVSPCVATFNNNGTITEQAYSVAAGCGSTYNFLITPNYAPRFTANYDPHIRLQSALQVNFSLDKTTPIAEGISLQLRAEAFNAFNKYWLYNAGFDNNPNDAAFGTLTRSAFGIGSSNQPRTIQLAAKLLF